MLTNPVKRDCCAPFFGQNRQHGAGGAGITAGDAIVCGYAVDPSGAGSIAVTDTLNSATFQHATLATGFGDGVASVIEIVYTLNSAHGSTDTITETATPGPSGYGTMSCEAWKNVATTSALDQNDNGVLTTSTNPTTGAVTTTGNGELIYGYEAPSTINPTAGNGTLIDVTTYISAPQYRIQPTSASGTTITWTAASDTWGAQLATFFSNGGTISVDGTCHNSANGITGSNTVVVTITC